MLRRKLVLEFLGEEAEAIHMVQLEADDGKTIYEEEALHKDRQEKSP